MSATGSIFDPSLKGALPSSFLHGYASAAYQIEGGYKQDGRGMCVWDEYLKDTENGEDACDSYNKWREDVQLLEQYGVNSYRFSIAWSRIIPLGGKDDPVNEAGIKYYSTLIDALLERGITPLVTLFHWDFPLELQKRYGQCFTKENNVLLEDFDRYATVCFQAFGDRVKNWITLDEPQVYTMLMSGSIEKDTFDLSTDRWTLAKNLVMIHSRAVDISARFLSTRQRTIAVLRLREERTGVENKMFKVSQLRESLLDLKTWLLFFTNICLSVPTFNSIIISGLGFNTRQTILISMPVGIISWIGALVLSWVAVKTGQRCLTTIGACVIPLLSTVLLHIIPRSNKSASLGILFLIYLYWPTYLLMMTTAMANTAGYTKKLLVYGIAYYGYLVGGIIGLQTFQAKQAPSYIGGITAMLVCYCVAIALIVIYMLNGIRLNRGNASWIRNCAEDTTGSDVLEEWQDLTDLANKKFKFLI